MSIHDKLVILFVVVFYVNRRHYNKPTHLNYYLSELFVYIFFNCCHSYSVSEQRLHEFKLFCFNCCHAVILAQFFHKKTTCIVDHFKATLILLCEHPSPMSSAISNIFQSSFPHKNTRKKIPKT
jgi:hypothetical protein